MTDTKDAAIVVVHDGRGRYLSVSRNGNPHDIAFPGGHLEEGEHGEAAAARELFEETGATAAKLEKIHEGPRPSGAGTLHVYRATVHDASRVENIRAEPGEHVRWAMPHEFTGAACSYGDFVRTHAAKLFAAKDAHTLDMSPSDVHTPAFAQPVPPKRDEVFHVPRWPLSDQVNMISAAKRKSLPGGKFALPAQRKYPIDTAARVRNAAARLEQNKSGLSPAEYKQAKGAIGRAAKRFGIHSEYNGDERTATDHLVPHMHVQAVIPHGGSLHVRHLTDAGGGEFVDTLTLADVPEEGAVWNQVACVGAFKGHPAGPFELTPSVFDEIVRNWEMSGRKHIPVDYEHASEADSTSGSIPVHGAPAQGWITELSNRGEQGLFGKIEWLPQARAQIRAGQYKFFSPAIRFGARDKVTGRPIGARLTSGALTNQPFLDNLAPIKARAQPANLIAARDEAAPMEDTQEQVVLMQTMASDTHHFITPSHEYMPKIKACMGLHPLATPEEMKDHLDRLRSHVNAAGGNVNATINGVSLGSYIHPLREMTFGANAHATTAEQIFDVVEHMIDAAIAEHVEEEHGGGHEIENASAVESDKGGAITATDQGEIDMTTLADKEAEITRLTLQLSDKNAEIGKLRTENEALLASKAARDEADLVADVEYVMSAHQDKLAHLGDEDAQRAILMKARKESPDFFARQYPKDADPRQAYLLRTVTPAVPAPRAEAASPTGIPELDPVFANQESVGDTATRLMNEGKLSFLEASERALKLHQLARQIA